MMEDTLVRCACGALLLQRTDWSPVGDFPHHNWHALSIGARVVACPTCGKDASIACLRPVTRSELPDAVQAVIKAAVQGELVRCACGYVMRRRPEQPRHGETWQCYTWHHRTAPEKLNYCPICGVAPSNLSTSPVTAEGGTMPPRTKTRRGVSSTPTGQAADATGDG